MKFDGVIFDFNGTLFFDTDYHVQVFDALSRELCGKPVTLHEMESVYAGKPNVEIFRIMTDNARSEEEYRALSVRKEAMYRKAVEESGTAALCPGAYELFALLKEKQVPFTIASASIRENIDFFRRMFDLDRWIDPETIVYDDGSFTSKTAMFEKAKAILHSSHPLVLEDSLSGITCAKTIGAETIVIDRPVLRQYYDKFDTVIAAVKDLREVPALIGERL